jgi:hypothetical protein
VKADLEAYMSQEPLERAQTWSALIDAGVMDVQEARERAREVFKNV